VKNTLIDAGPLIALFDKSDKYHPYIKSFLKDYKGILITTWPVITDTMYMINFNVNVQIDFLEWIKRGAIQIINLENNHIERLIELSQKYSDVPMDLADSSLIVISELKGINDIITIDSDYNIYKTKSRKNLNNIFDKYMQSIKIKKL
jgi:uncharacterized protein